MWPLAKDLKAAFYLWPRCAHSSWWINANQIQWHFLICWMCLKQVRNNKYDINTDYAKGSFGFSNPCLYCQEEAADVCHLVNVRKICSLPIVYIVWLFLCAWRGGVWGVIKGSRACLSSLRAGSSHVKLLPQDTVIVKAKLPEPRFHLHWWNKHQGWISVLIKPPLCVKRQQR